MTREVDVYRRAFRIMRAHMLGDCSPTETFDERLDRLARSGPTGARRAAIIREASCGTQHADRR